MKTISIQAEDGLDKKFDRNLIIDGLNNSDINYEVYEDQSDINFYIDTDNIQATWKAIKDNIISIDSVAKSCVVVCQGESGWDDIVFLHDNDDISKKGH